MGGQEHLVREICLALSAALERTEEKFSPLRQSTVDDEAIDVEVFDETLAALWRARILLMTLADQCRAKISDAAQVDKNNVN